MLSALRAARARVARLAAAAVTLVTLVVVAAPGVARAEIVWRGDFETGRADEAPGEQARLVEVLAAGARGARP